nr:hypothetical protein [uncultured Acetatifactor sp.]
MKKISLEELQKESRTESYPEQYRYICGLIEQQRITPVKSSPRNGKKPALYTSYWLAEEKPDYGEELEELQFRTVPAIRTDYYLNHPEVYREERKWVRLLNRFFLEQGEAGSRNLPYVSLNERSFRIWGREKFLQREQGRKILAHCGVGLEVLRVYRTTEPLAYYSRTRRVPQTILILENKDTFYTMRRWLMGEGGGMAAFGNKAGGLDFADKAPAKAGRAVETGADEPDRAGGAGEAAQGNTGEPPFHRIFGSEISTVIYGAGKGILRSSQDFRFCVEPHINHPENEILYFGDLDYEGIGIYERLAALFSTGEETAGRAGRHEIKPFIRAYEKMMDKARGYGKDFLPDMSGNQNRNLSGLFFRYFSHDTKEAMIQLLEAGKYIPQEIVAITDF